MTAVELRRFQELVANLLKVKDGMAEGLYGMYKAYIKAGFTSDQAMRLIEVTLCSSKE